MLRETKPIHLSSDMKPCLINLTIYMNNARCLAILHKCGQFRRVLLDLRPPPPPKDLRGARRTRHVKPAPIRVHPYVGGRRHEVLPPAALLGAARRRRRQLCAVQPLVLPVQHQQVLVRDRIARQVENTCERRMKLVYRALSCADTPVFMAARVAASPRHPQSRHLGCLK